MNDRQQEYYDFIVNKIKKGIETGIYHRDSRILAPYVRSNDRIEATCGYPEHMFTLHPGKFKTRGDWCAVCRGNCNWWTRKRFYEIIALQGRTALSPYINAHTPVKTRCSQNHVTMAHPWGVLREHCDCNHCYGNGCADRGRELFTAAVERLGYIQKSPYITANIPVHLTCNKGHDCYPRPGAVIHYGGRCSGCFQNTPAKGLASLMKVLNYRKETLLGTYVNCDTRVDIRCFFNHVYSGHPGNIVSVNHGCTQCQESSLEQEARLVLDEMGIVIQTQHYVSTVTGNFKFDIRFNHGGKEWFLEVDGHQHFRHVDCFHKTVDEFRRAQQRDRYKDEYCLSNKINLLRIPYTQAGLFKECIQIALADPKPLSCFDADLYRPLYREDEWVERPIPSVP